jgi:hypothetical protein
MMNEIVRMGYTLHIHKTSKREKLWKMIYKSHMYHTIKIHKMVYTSHMYHTIKGHKIVYTSL